MVGDIFGYACKLRGATFVDYEFLGCPVVCTILGYDSQGDFRIAVYGYRLYFYRQIDYFGNVEILKHLVGKYFLLVKFGICESLLFSI